MGGGTAARPDRQLRVAHEALVLATIGGARRPRRRAARRQLPQPEPGRHHDPVRERLPDRLDVDGHRRRLAVPRPRPLLLRARAHRPGALAPAAPLDRARVGARRRPRPDGGHRRRGGVVPARRRRRRAARRRRCSPRGSPSRPRRRRDAHERRRGRALRLLRRHLRGARRRARRRARRPPAPATGCSPGTTGSRASTRRASSPASTPTPAPRCRPRRPCSRSPTRSRAAGRA